MIVQYIILAAVLIACISFVAKKIYSAFKRNDCGCGSAKSCDNCPFRK